MSTNINLKKGLNVPISGAAAPVVSRLVMPDIVAIQPESFKGFAPRLLVKEGAKVLAGSPVMSDKKNPDILATSPVSGTVKSVVRGEKRRLLAVLVEADAQQEHVEFSVKDAASLTQEEVKSALLQSGLWLSLIQRPYGIIADPAVQPKGIFVSTFSTAPLAPECEFAYGNELDMLQAGIDALSKIAPVHVSFCGKCGKRFSGLKNAQMHSFTGKHPAGNVGVQISHISPILKGETVWTISPALLIAVGRLFKQGQLNLLRKVAVTGPAANEPSYIETVPGMPMSNLASYYGNATDQIRIISGDVLSGKNVGVEGYLGWADNQVSIVKEGRDEEWFGWARPFRFNQYSSDHTYFNWCLKPLLGKRKYDMDTNLHGGPRAFVMSDSYYAKVLPMDIYPLYLIKACLAGDIDKMERFGIYEVLPEDFAVCEYLDPSKNYIQSIISDGIGLMLKEMA